MGDYYFPTCTLRDNAPSVGRWAELCERYLQENHPSEYTKLIWSCELSGLLRFVQKDCEAKLTMDLPEVRFHDARHTFATLSLQSGVDIKTVSEALGHASIAFTLSVYGHVTELMQQDMADRMERLIGSL